MADAKQTPVAKSAPAETAEPEAEVAGIAADPTPTASDAPSTADIASPTVSAATVSSAPSPTVSSQSPAPEELAPTTTTLPSSEPEEPTNSIDPATWPSQTAGTVTDPGVLRANGIPVVTAPVLPASVPATAVVETAAPVATEPEFTPGVQIWQCLWHWLPSKTCPLFQSNAHLDEPPVMVVCPNCNSTTVRKYEDA